MKFIFVLTFFVASSVYPSSARVGTLRPTFATECARILTLPTGTQNLIDIKPLRKLVHRGEYGWIDSVAWIQNGTEQTRIVTTSREKIGLRTFLETGRNEKTAKSNQVYAKQTWSPVIQAVAPNGKFFITRGGLSSPTVYFGAKIDVPNPSTIEQDLRLTPVGPTYSTRVRMAKNDLKKIFAEIIKRCPDTAALKLIKERLDLSPDISTDGFPENIRSLVTQYRQAYNIAYEVEPDSYIQSTLITPDSKNILSVSTDGQLTVWEVGKNSLIRKRVLHLTVEPELREDGFFRGALRNAAISPDGKWLAAGLNNGLVLEYAISDILSRRADLILRPAFHHKMNATSYPTAFGSPSNTALAYTKNGQRLLAATAWIDRYDERAARRVELWNIKSGSLADATQTLTMLHSAILQIFPAYGNNFVTTSRSPDDLFQIWTSDRHQSTLVASFRFESQSAGKATDPVRSAVLSPDGKMLAVCSAAGNLSLWSVTESRLLVTTPIRAVTQSIAFSPDGKFLATVGAAGSAYIYRISDLLNYADTFSGVSLSWFVGVEGN